MWLFYFWRKSYRCKDSLSFIYIILFLYLFFKHSSRIKTQLFTTLTGREVTVDLSRFITDTVRTWCWSVTINGTVRLNQMRTNESNILIQSLPEYLTIITGYKDLLWKVLQLLQLPHLKMPSEQIMRFFHDMAFLLLALDLCGENRP